MNQVFWTSERVTGSLLVAGLLIAVLALIITAARGALPAFSAMLQGSMEKMVPYAATFRLTTLMFAIAWLPQLLGFGLLTMLLLRAGDQYLATLAFILVLVASVFGVLNATFLVGVDPWAAQVAARTGSIPGIYEPLKEWIDNAFRLAYVAHLTAVVAFGWVALRTGFMSPWVSWLVIGWSLLWLLAGLIGAGAPAIPLIMPAVIGVVLLFR